ncbi:MAG: helix-turn-helix domain-containing protein [Luteococcus sp.]|uniref:helix-turn-helix domain-containing protein n=1 Tax=Luteococcus sp. TaxID=1969402 RepID=UPI00264858CA|nr:helix-turn-helix domain-containing protein [Luteococcus sp.]MDN5564576.1 helix-turn-helix domain-containing protein [Luteococcus sp.]
MDFNVTLGTTQEINDDTIDHAMDALAAAGVTVHSVGDHAPDRLAVTVTVPARDLTSAIRMAMAMAEGADLGKITSVEAMSTAEFDQAAEAPRSSIPDLYSLAQASEVLGKSRPTLQRLVGRGDLEGVQVEGVGFVVTKASVDELARLAST